MEKLQKGFTLIEIAIVLVIVGILLGVGVKSCLSGIETARIEKTKDQLEILTAFVKREGCKENNLSFKIPENLTKDGWNQKIEVKNFLGNNTICGSLSSNGTIILQTGETVKNVAVAFISLGSNRKLDSKVEENSVTVKEDDIVSFITLPQLKSLCCKNRKLKIITETLPPIVEGESYEVTLAVKGGEPPYHFEVNFSNLGISFNATTDNPFYTLEISENETENLNNPSAKVNLNVKDKKGNSDSKTYYVTVIRRKLN